MTTCELRKKAAQVIHERGWCQGIRENSDGCVCIRGALQLALSDGESPWGCEPEMYAAEKAMGFSGGMYFSTAPMWNDAPERTQAEVIARLVDGCEE